MQCWRRVSGVLPHKSYLLAGLRSGSGGAGRISTGTGDRTGVAPRPGCQSSRQFGQIRAKVEPWTNAVTRTRRRSGSSCLPTTHRGCRVDQRKEDPRGGEHRSIRGRPSVHRKTASSARLVATKTEISEISTPRPGRPWAGAGWHDICLSVHTGRSAYKKRYSTAALKGSSGTYTKT